VRRRARRYTILPLAVACLAALGASTAIGVGARAEAIEAPEAIQAAPDFPLVDLPEAVSGSAAISALGRQLPEVARAYGRSEGLLRLHLQNDPSLAVDKKGRLFYVEETSPTLAESGVPSLFADAVMAAELAPLSDTFMLHSLPGANRVIYLDFDGQLLSGTAWNDAFNNGQDISAPAFDIDGNPATFNDTERTRIQQIWQRVAEDYAPFQVDVTTEYPGEAAITRSSSSDQVYGMRVLISPISYLVGNAGGIAYVDVFDMVGDEYKPALVFPENLGPYGEKYVAEAASHETGHTLNLLHDGVSGGASYYPGHGSGETGWAPIMGAGYYQNLTQWSKGEYLNANNHEDDLTLIAAAGAPVRADDHGNAIDSATALEGSGELTVTGLIGQSSDVDVFIVSTGSGSLSVSAACAGLGPDLDVALELWDGEGSSITSDNPLSSLSASLSVQVVAGTYYLAVRGTGAGDPLGTGYSTYASLGRYTLTASVPAPAQAGIDLFPGWNLVAGGPGTSFGALLYEWTSSGYQQVTDPEPWKGYWVYMEEETSVTLQTVAGPDTVFLDDGWNLVGNPMSTTASLSVSSGADVFVWTGQVYAVVGSLSPGQGAWIYAQAGDSLTFTPAY